MVRAIERGLSILDFEALTLGMIIDFIITYDNDKAGVDEDDATRSATQSDYDNF